MPKTRLQEVLRIQAIVPLHSLQSHSRFLPDMIGLTIIFGLSKMPQR
jgi:hypothetical protein